jgi:phage virion morphogenesis protein
MADDVGSTFEIDLSGAEQLLSRARDQYEDLSPLMRTLSEVIVSGVEDNFAAESGPNGPWAELAPETIEERKEIEKWPGPILQRTGQLIASIQPFNTDSTAGASTNKTYAAIHQAGGTSDMPPGPAGVPARPYMYISDDTETEIEEEVDAFNDEAWE